MPVLQSQMSEDAKKEGDMQQSPRGVEKNCLLTGDGRRVKRPHSYKKHWFVCADRHTVTAGENDDDGSSEGECEVYTSVTGETVHRERRRERDKWSVKCKGDLT